ncbi:MAG: 50S ribosomal protein L10 [Candidatus Micrarchaeota archaeon]
MADKKADQNKPSVKEKAKEVAETIAEMKNYKTVALVSLDKLPDALYQSLRKKIRSEGGKVKTLRKPVLSRVLQSDKKLAARVNAADRPCGLILTNSSPYQINQFFKQNTKKRGAKINEIAPFDIIVPEGETDLPPGPALSELKGAGLNVQIKGGKIVISKDSTVAKTGEKITMLKAKALQTLGIKPFTIKANIVFGYDREYIYEKSLLDLGDTLDADLLAAERSAFSLSVNAGYPTETNAEFVMRDAYLQGISFAVNSKTYNSVTIEADILNALAQSGAIEKKAEATKPAEAAAEAPKTDTENKG